MTFKYRDWVCPKCGAKSEDVPIDVPDQFCPYCGEKMVKAYTSAPAVSFKGAGWTPKHYK